MTVFTIVGGEAADMEILRVVPPVPNLVAVIDSITYTALATAHTISILRATALTQTDGRSASGQKVVGLSDNGAMNTVNAASTENIAANDHVCWLDENGKYEAERVDSVSGSSITLFTNLSVPIAAGSPIWIFGEVARSSSPAFTPPASATTTLSMSVAAGIPAQSDTNQRSGINEPMIAYSDNATNAGLFVAVSGRYTTEESLA